MSPAEVKSLKNQWNAFIAAALAKQLAMYEYALTDSERTEERAGKLPQATTDAIAQLLKGPGIGRTCAWHITASRNVPIIQHHAPIDSAPRDF
jgi:hypothetical protein